MVSSLTSAGAPSLGEEVIDKGGHFHASFKRYSYRSFDRSPHVFDRARSAHRRCLHLTGLGRGGRWEAGLDLGSAGLSSSPADLETRVSLRLGYHVSRRFGVEGQLIGAAAVLDATLRAWMINGVFELRPDQAIAPYLLAGVGYAELEDVALFNGPTIGRDGAAVQAGVGSRFFFGDARRIGLRAELTSLWENTDVFSRGRYTSLSLGIAWRFGR